MNVTIFRQEKDRRGNWIAMLKQEMKRLEEFDYVVVNRDNHLDETVKTIAAIITAEKCKVKQRKIELQGGVR